MRKLKLLMLPVLLSLLVGCNSQIPTLRDWADQCVGLPIVDLEKMEARPGSYASRVGWKTKTYDLPNGNRVHVAPNRDKCEIHFEVDKAGIIVGYQPVGKGCRNQ